MLVKAVEPALSLTRIKACSRISYSITIGALLRKNYITAR